MRGCYYGPRLIIPVASLPALDKCYSIFADATAFCPVIHKGKVSHLGNSRRIPFLHSDFTRKHPPQTCNVLPGGERRGRG